MLFKNKKKLPLQHRSAFFVYIASKQLYKNNPHVNTALMV